MRVMMLIIETPEDFAKRTVEPAGNAYWKAWESYSAAINDKIIGGNVLGDGSTAATIRVRDGNRVIQDGPYAESKEALGGYMIFDVETFEEALELASSCPAAASGAVELRPIIEMNG